EDDPELFAQEYPATPDEAFIQSGLPFFSRAQLLWLDQDMEQGSVGRLEVLDMESLEQVAEYDASSAPHVFARHLAMLGRFYKEALLCPEVQSSGGGGGRELLVYL